jgi:hypothetical protein
MSPADEQLVPEMDPTELYREDVYTDRRVGTIRVMTPVGTDGTTDGGRPVVYAGQTQLMTAMGALPLSFDIDADSLEEAIRGFSAAANKAVEETLRELQEMRREAASSIIVPEAGGGGAAMPGAVPGGGKIKLP